MDFFKKKRVKGKRKCDEHSVEDEEKDVFQKTGPPFDIEYHIRCGDANAKAIDQMDKKFKLSGSLIRKPADPPEFPKHLMMAEYQEMFSTSTPLTIAEYKMLEEHLRKKSDLRSSDHVVISEKVVEEKKDSKKTETNTTRSLLRIGSRYAEGRFAGIYMVQNESSFNGIFDKVVSTGFLAMKTSLRTVQSSQVSARLTREIRALGMLTYKESEEADRRIPQVLLEGRVLGVPFFVTLFFDPNLEKCREEMGGVFSMPSVFYIAQEILLALKFVHKKGYVHRDVKPTNVVSHSKYKQWYLIDFGDIVAYGIPLPLSPPDGLTLPFISRESHVLLNNVNGLNYYTQDIESWFYILIDLIKPLPWHDNNNINEVHKMKNKFWDNLEQSLPAVEYTPYPLKIAKLIKYGKSLGSPYKEITKIVQEGFVAMKALEPKWTYDWIDRAATAQINKERKYRRAPFDEKNTKQAGMTKATATAPESTVPQTKTTAPTRQEGPSVYLNSVSATYAGSPTRNHRRFTPGETMMPSHSMNDPSQRRGKKSEKTGRSNRRGKTPEEKTALLARTQSNTSVKVSKKKTAPKVVSDQDSAKTTPSDNTPRTKSNGEFTPTKQLPPRTHNSKYLPPGASPYVSSNPAPSGYQYRSNH